MLALRAMWNDVEVILVVFMVVFVHLSVIVVSHLWHKHFMRANWMSGNSSQITETWCICKIWRTDLNPRLT